MSHVSEVEGGVASLVLPSGHVTVLDAADLPLIEPYRWFLKRSNGGKLYVYGYRVGEHKNRRKSMHTVLLDAGPLEVDHINGDGLDNRRSNLRAVTHAQNLHNACGRSGSTSPYKGVCWNSQKSKWLAKIKVDGKTRHLGFHTDPWDAAQAYNDAAIESWGEFAFVNGRQAVS